MKYYRYEIVEYAVTDIDGEYISSPYPNPKLEVKEYETIKETPKGYWISYHPYKDLSNWKYYWKKWVSKTSKKKFAYPTKEDALVNFIKRTERRIEILDRQLQTCKISLNLAKNRKV
jgi:hypothetical protein